MYTAERLWKYGDTYVPPPIARHEEEIVDHWLERSSSESNLLLHHYTTAKGLKGIIESGEIWCSEIQYLNDAQEIEYGSTLVRDKIEDLQEEYSANADIREGLLDNLLMRVKNFPGTMYRVFVACFCESGDLLSQWRGYAEEGGGYAVGFSFDNNCYVQTEAGQTYKPNLRKVLYNRERQEELLDRYLRGICEIWSEYDLGSQGDTHVKESSLALHLMNTLMDWIVSFKHPGFEEENEWRLVRMLRGMKEAEPHAKFRPSDGLLVPYVQAPLMEREQEEGGENVHYFPLSEIRYGPTLPSDRANLSIQSLLRTAGQKGDFEIREDVSIEAPDVPFRG